VIWSLVEDITERKKLDKMKDEFIATVSHELRTPLTSIKGALGLLNGGATGDLPPKANQLLHTAERNATRLSLLINDLLDMEKLVAGKMLIQLKKQELGPLLDDAIESVKPYQHQNQIRIHTPNHWPTVMANVDGARLIQALTNLLSNAIKFSPEEGQVDVSVTKSRKDVEISIRDYGSGVDKEFQNRLFQRFSQADSSDNRKLPGTGLGLAITREICQQMGGDVGYRDAEGGGALFFIQLQVAQ
jgi:signal transduction histidine kinase